jgi:hypothetical protein
MQTYSGFPGMPARAKGRQEIEAVPAFCYILPV